MTDDTGGCGLYRVSYPSNYLSQNHNVSILKTPKEIDLQLLNYDLFIIQRPFSDFYHEKLYPWLRNRKRIKKVYVDVDDNLFELPDYNPAKRFCTENKLKILSTNIELVDGVICSTEPLAQYIHDHFNRRVIVIPNNIQSRPLTPHHNTKLKVGWVGSRSHNGDFSNELITALERIQEEVEIIIYGEIPDCLSHIKITNQPWTEVNEYHNTIDKLKLDIGLIPCQNNLFNQSKSNIKFLEYSLHSIATISDRVYPYVHTILENETGLFENWYENLRLLIDNESERIRLSYNAYNFVKQHYCFNESYGKIWEEFLNEI